MYGYIPNLKEINQMDKTRNQLLLEQFEKQLRVEEKSNATILKYAHDVRNFLQNIKEEPLHKEQVIAYKENLRKHYKITSTNSMLAAINSFLRFIGRPDCVVKLYKMQRETFREENKELSREEYIRLLNAAKNMGKQRLFLLLQTIASTGIRVSELRFITVESLSLRRARVSLKGKTRLVILPRRLCRELADYAKGRQIQTGSVFITRTGNPLDRSNILHEMKALSKKAEVREEKIFPHNLRHLFALTYYMAERNICHLADLLGHANINTTRIYTLASCEEQEQQINNLGLLMLEKENIPKIPVIL